jgi:hypothetical protein
MIPTQADLKTYLLEEIDEQVRFIREFFSVEWDVEVAYTFAAGVHRSRGGYKNGKPYVKFALHRFLNGTSGFQEYASYNADLTIGGITTGHWESCIKVLVAHELAHAFQFSVMRSEQIRVAYMSNVPEYHGHGDVVGQMRAGHGAGFKRIYRILRKHVNYQLVDLPSTEMSQHEIADANHPFLNKIVNLPATGRVIIVEHHPRKRKFPLVCQTTAGKQYKMSLEMFNTFKEN